MIPKVIHFIWIDNPMPSWIKYNIDYFKTLNPEYEVMIHTNEFLLPEFKEAYNNIKGEHSCARKSDLLRVSILIKEGGWYFDTDFIPFLPINYLVNKYRLNGKMFLTRATDTLIANGIMGVPFKSIGIRLIKNEIMRSCINPKEDNWGSYGTVPVTNVYNRNNNLFVMGTSKEFYPISYTERLKTIQCYRKLIKNNINKDVLIQEFGFEPFCMHLHAQDELNLENIK